MTVDHMFSSAVEVRKNNTYITDNGENGYVLMSSKMYPDGNDEIYWFGYRLNRFEAIEQCKEQFCVFVCRNKTTLIINLPRTFLDGLKDKFSNSTDDDGNIKHYHIKIYKQTNGKVTLLLPKPYLKKIDISKYVVAEL